MDDEATSCNRINEAQCKCCYSHQRRTTVVCMVTCVFVLSCCVYCTWMVIFSSRCGMTEHGVRKLEHASSATQPRTEHQERIECDTMTYERIKRSTDKQKTRHNAKRPRKKGPKAAHYVTDVLVHYQQLPGYNHRKVSGTCEHIAELDGRLCRDEVFTPNSEQLNIFTEADWVNPKRTPFKKLNGGIFEAKYNGVYLLYGQLLILDDGISRNVSIVQSRGTAEIQRIMCFESFKSTEKSHRFKTCGIMALFAARKKDKFTLRNFSSNSKISLRVGANYIGAVVLK